MSYKRKRASKNPKREVQLEHLYISKAGSTTKNKKIREVTSGTEKRGVVGLMGGQPQHVIVHADYWCISTMCFTFRGSYQADNNSTE